MIEELLDDKVGKLLHNGQSVIRTVMHIVVVRELMNMLHKNVMGDRLDAWIAKFFGVHIGAEGCQSGCIPEIHELCFLGHLSEKTDSAVEGKKYYGVGHEGFIYAVEVYTYVDE